MVRILSALVSSAIALARITSASSKLPVIFFHGVTTTWQFGHNFAANLTAEGREVVSLSFCDAQCSIESLLIQIPEAVKAVRNTVANNSVFDDGYMIIGHSQGGIIARATIEEMDDHKAKRFISLAGLQNGQFIGHNAVDIAIEKGAPSLTNVVPERVFNYTKYVPKDYYGKMQKDFTIFSIENPDTQYEYAQFNVQRWPQFGSWSTTNKFLPVYNNVNPCLPGNDQCISDQQRRRANFLKLEEAHFFASPVDDAIMPWESCVFGRYTEVDTLDEIETSFMNMTIVNITDTLEYREDTFGLRTLDERGGLHLHIAPNVTHSCWCVDEKYCKWAPVYDEYIYPALN
uniref:AB hydrolase-1 domain-containing protein n=1 Tax=Phytophthora ramorum TaxID=164328 RepID=H3GRY6_PHYRM